jgi:selenocysteine lyase/cysteine desulfurase
MQPPRRSASPYLSDLSRRDFARMLALGGSAAWLSGGAPARAATAGPLAPTPAAPDEKFWRHVREQFVMPPEISVMNAANLCPSPHCVLKAMYDKTREMDRDPSYPNRAPIAAGKETTRRLLAEFLRVTPEEIIITRNTSEANNMVSLGVELRAGDEVVLFGDNHPSNKAAWESRRARYGFSIVEIAVLSPHPGAEHYLNAVRRAFTARTRVLAFTHQTSTVGDLYPARELCQLAREHGVLTLIDGAQSFGLMDVDLSIIQPDFYTGSAHKWPCGPKETGVLFVNRRSHDKLWPCTISAYPGAVGISITHEAFGQRDEPAIAAFGEALEFQNRIGRKVIAARSRELTEALIAGLRRIEGVKLWTHPSPERSGAVVSFLPGSLDPAKLAAVLYEREQIGLTARTGTDRPGVRISPHFYNLHEEIDRVVGAITRYIASGLPT